MSNKLLVWSPHLDDAVLSVGAALAMRADAGVEVIVATVFSEVPCAARAAEDRAALALVGARPLHLGLRDAPLRGHALSWTSLCEREPDISLVDEVAARVARVIEDERPDDIWAPLSCGGHIDHRAVTVAVLRLPLQVALYEDRPYARARGAVRQALARQGITARLVDERDLNDEVDRDVHFLRAVGAPSLVEHEHGTGTMPQRNQGVWHRDALAVGAQRARRQQAIDAYASQREQLVGRDTMGGWPWDDRCEHVWRRHDSRG